MKMIQNLKPDVDNFMSSQPCIADKQTSATLINMSNFKQLQVFVYPFVDEHNSKGQWLEINMNENLKGIRRSIDAQRSVKKKKFFV